MENNNIAEKFLDKISNMSKIWIWVSMCLWIICFIIAIWLLYYVIFSSKIELNWENIVYILWWLFFSWLVLIILPLYFWKIDKDIQEKIIKEEIIKEEIIKEKISKIKDFLKKEQKINFSRNVVNDWGWKMFDYKKDENNIIGFWYSLEKRELVNIWIDCKNIELLNKIENSNKEYWKKYSDNFWKNTIIPKDSQNLYEKSEEEIAELIKKYIAIIEKQTN